MNKKGKPEEEKKPDVKEKKKKGKKEKPVEDSATKEALQKQREALREKRKVEKQVWVLKHFMSTSFCASPSIIIFY